MPNTPPFVHLHVHTRYSLMDGMCRLPDLVDACARDGAGAVAITDHGVLYGVVDFHEQAKRAGIKPVLGCELPVAAAPGEVRPLVLLAETDLGYANLVRLVSLAHLEGPPGEPRVGAAALARHAGGLIALSGGARGAVGAACAAGDAAGAARAASAFAGLFGRASFFLELQNQGLPGQPEANRLLRETAREAGVACVVTNDVHYLVRGDAAAHEVLRCVGSGTTLRHPAQPPRGSDRFDFCSPAGMAARFPDDGEALSLTADIAARCNVALAFGSELHFPRFELPPGTAPRGRARPGAAEFAYLRRLAEEGARARCGLRDPRAPADGRERAVAERLAQELDVIHHTGFVNYFLVVWDFVHFARARGIPVGPGRGSGAGSLVAYALGITGVDPLRHGLVFERFLNPERVSPPDFDIDFCQERRGEVIEYVRERYGRDRVAQIIAFGTFGARTAIRDVGRVLEMPLAACDRLARKVPEEPGMTLARARQHVPAFAAALAEDPLAAEVFRHAAALEGLPRNASTHAAGVVIGERPLVELVPLSRGRDGEVVTQFDMDALGRVGLLKLDFLGLRTLTVIREAAGHVARAGGGGIDPDTLPVDDPETFVLINRGDTAGVFQLESRGMRDLARRIRLTRFEDLVALIALFRPGPMTMLDDYVKRKEGAVPIVYDHPLLEPVLAETYGVMLYQEQVQQAAHVLAGFTMGQGDLLRRAMGKKDDREMATLREAFVEGCARTCDMPPERAGALFERIRRFAGYGFNKSHSTAYAVVSARTAWLKTHHPAAFFAALLSSETAHPDKLHALLREARRTGVELRPPCVNRSAARFRPEGPAVRFGLAGVKHVGEEAARAVERERGRGGPFAGLVDFCSRAASTHVNRRAVESLAACGAFDFTGLARARLVAGLDFALGRAAGVRRDRAAGQAALPGLLGGAAPPSDDALLPPAEPWPDLVRLGHEKERLGFHVSDHPLVRHAWMTRALGLDAFPRPGSGPPPPRVRLAGVLRLPAPAPSPGDGAGPAAPVRLETLEGEVELVPVPGRPSCLAPLRKDGAVLCVGGSPSREGARACVAVDEACPLAEAPARLVRRVRIHLGAAVAESEVLPAVRDVLRRFPGQAPVDVCLECATGERAVIEAGRAFRVSVSEALLRGIEALTGEDTVYLETGPAP